ncbi:PAS domain-containing sensor histidine kinase [Spirosoma sp.]|uniref:sensor histidine kinase n=1 Tax=Spirosoma sp. TaxID=1899569 RepID=UPI0026069E64|nr:PAS domain-containing sensor histidine kinase [Spirosoma sp.]MCX6217073.1 PAS domain-containing sensor histidine kinase [Spirosoma sp.]
MKNSLSDKPLRPSAFFAPNLPGLLTLKGSIQEEQTGSNLTISWISESAGNLLKMAGTEWHIGDSFKQSLLEFGNVDIAPIFSDFSKKGEGFYHLALESGYSVGLNLSQSPIGIIGQLHYPVNQQEKNFDENQNIALSIRLDNVENQLRYTKLLLKQVTQLAGLDNRQFDPQQDRYIINAESSLSYIENQPASIRNKNGLSFHMPGSANDITDTVIVEKAIQESKLIYRSIADKFKQVVFQVDLEENWSFLNEAWERITGFTKAESLGRPFFDFIHTEDEQLISHLFSENFHAKAGFDRTTVDCLKKDGGTCSVELSVWLDRDDDDTITGYTGTIIYIAEQPELHQSMSDEQTLLKEIAENINSIIWIRDPKELKFLYINSYFEKFTGYKIDQLRTDSNSLFKFIHPDDQPFLMQLYEMPTEKNLTIEFRIKLSDQTYRWLEAKLLTLADTEGTIIHRMGIATDITEGKKKVESLQLALEQEKEINKLKSMFVSMVSHQFKTPLSTMQTSVDLINNYLQAPSDKSSSIHRHLNIIQNEIKKYGNLINDMLILGKIEAGKVKVYFEQIDLVEFCQKIINAYFVDNLQGRKVELNHEKPRMLIFLDVALMEHVLVNLLSNALKFSQKSPKIMLESLDNEIVIKVVDEGIGISKNDISYLFEDFYRASNASAVPGSGLGLSIAKKFVELQQGTINVESQLGLGTTFRLTLPKNRSTN